VARRSGAPGRAARLSAEQLLRLRFVDPDAPFSPVEALLQGHHDAASLRDIVRGLREGMGLQLDGTWGAAWVFLEDRGFHGSLKDFLNDPQAEEDLNDALRAFEARVLAARTAFLGEEVAAAVQVGGAAGASKAKCEGPAALAERRTYAPHLQGVSAFFEGLPTLSARFLGYRHSGGPALAGLIKDLLGGRFVDAVAAAVEAHYPPAPPIPDQWYAALASDLVLKLLG
jgi:hypothetical protein